MEKPFKTMTVPMPWLANDGSRESNVELATQEELQILVDIHYLYGMSMSEVKQHLIVDHSVANTHFPIPSKRAKKAIRKGEHVTRKELKKLQDEYNEITNEVSMVSVRQEVEHPTYPTEEQPLDYEDVIYESVGVTFMDRLMYGYSRLLTMEGNSHLSDFERVRTFVDRLAATKPVFVDGTIGDALMSGGDDEKRAMLVLGHLYPWFASKRFDTHNIQIDSTLLESFLSAKSLDIDKGFELIDKPVYVDIYESKHGFRYIPGIIARPMPNGAIRIFTAIEWKEQGIEAFLFWDAGERDLLMSKNAAIDLFYESVDEDDVELSQEKIQMIMGQYAPLMPEVEKVLASAVLYHKQKTEASSKKEWVPITSPALIQKEIKDKKKSNKKKTRSIFKVQKLSSLLSERSGGTAGSRSPIDHVFTVSGHFRWQPYGKGREKVKLIWIDEHEKGKGNRLYPENRPTLDKASS